MIKVDLPLKSTNEANKCKAFYNIKTNLENVLDLYCKYLNKGSSLLFS